MNEIKIYEFNDCDWVAAKNIRDAVREYCSVGWHSVHEALEGLTDTIEGDRLKKYTFIDDVYNSGKSKKRSFKKQLENMIKRGEKFPCMFATSEY